MASTPIRTSSTPVAIKNTTLGCCTCTLAKSSRPDIPGICRSAMTALTFRSCSACRPHPHLPPSCTEYPPPSALPPRQLDRNFRHRRSERPSLHTDWKSPPNLHRPRLLDYSRYRFGSLGMYLMMTPLILI